mgnify:CR=1 FL=1
MTTLMLAGILGSCITKPFKVTVSISTNLGHVRDKPFANPATVTVLEVARISTTEEVLDESVYLFKLDLCHYRAPRPLYVVTADVIASAMLTSVRGCR